MHKREESADAASIGVFMIDAKGVAASLQIGESSVWKLVKYEPDFPKPSSSAVCPDSRSMR
ncbi:hypothetical protein [Sutterella wadsworthensis]|uniref:hypothetical protein n=1 Tax=Sutterella wadsworthensis TaxID=40545 RepID=UPI003FF04C87